MRFYVYLPCIPPLQKYEHSEASTRIHYILQVRDLNCVMTQAAITEWWELVYKSQNQYIFNTTFKFTQIINRYMNKTPTFHLFRINKD